MDESDKVAELISESKRLVVFIGAGISTEFGISDFCSLGGTWDRYDLNEFNHSRFLIPIRIK